MPKNPHAEKAKHLLVHYFRLADVVADSDNRAEIEEIVDEIVRAAVLEAKDAILAAVPVKRA